MAKNMISFSSFKNVVGELPLEEKRSDRVEPQILFRSSKKRINSQQQQQQPSSPPPISSPMATHHQQQQLSITPAPSPNGEKKNERRPLTMKCY